MPQNQPPPDRPCSPACERNQQPIFEAIQPLLRETKNLLEIGSGTGQHAVYMGEKMPHLTWHTSDLLENHAAIYLWLNHAGLSNVKAPLELDVLRPRWPGLSFDAIFSANTLHIISWQAVQALFAGVATQLKRDGMLIVYGPFNYGGEFTSESNRQFDLWLKARNSDSGIRDFEALQRLATQYRLEIVDDLAMPSNNRILIWQKT